MYNDRRTPLRKAVDKLISDGKIKQDKDLQEIFHLKKSTISAYLNNPKPGKRFLVEFEKKFGISLNEFESADNSKKDKDAKIDSLQYENIQLRLKEIEANLKESLSNQSVMMRQVAVAMRLAAERYAGNDKKKLQEELNKIDTMIASGFE